MSRMKLAASILLACALLAAGFGAFALRYGHSAAWRVPADRRPWVERALAVAAAGSGTSREELRRATRPRLWNRPGEICVTLATHRSDGGGSYRVCFDRSDGRVVEERLHGSSFGPAGSADPFWELVW